MLENWRKIPEWDYEVSDLGRVRRIATGNIVGGFARAGGYRSVYLCDGKQRRRNAKVHQLVCFAFHGEPPSPRHQVAHWDGDGSNNRATNLRWATPKENSDDRVRHGRGTGGFLLLPHGGENHPSAKLTNENLIDIRNALADGVLQRIIADRFGVHRTAISKIKRGVRWAEAP